MSDLTVLPAARISLFHLAAPTSTDGWCTNVCGRCSRRPAYQVAPSRQLRVRADGLLADRDGWPNAALYGQFRRSRVYAVWGERPVTCEACHGTFAPGRVACGECERIR